MESCWSAPAVADEPTVNTFSAALRLMAFTTVTLMSDNSWRAGRATAHSWSISTIERPSKVTSLLMSRCLLRGLLRSVLRDGDGLASERLGVRHHGADVERQRRVGRADAGPVAEQAHEVTGGKRRNRLGVQLGNGELDGMHG